MEENYEYNKKTEIPEKGKVLLMLLPFWTPLMPPMGISRLKTYLRKYGYKVVTTDANMQPELWDIHNMYFNLLKGIIPVEKQGNFFNIGYNVLRNHMMAWLNCEHDGIYFKLLETIISKHYYYNLHDEQLIKIDEIIDLFYSRLKYYILNMINEQKPSVLGLSIYSGNLASSLFVFKLVKDNYTNIKTVMGGGIFSDQLPIGSPDLDFFISKTPYIDKILIGQGEKLLLDFLRGNLPEQKKIITLHDIGIEPLELELMDVPDYSDFNTRSYIYIGGTASSSCPYQCSFCNVKEFWGKYKKRNPKDTVAEMIKIYNTYEKQLFFMTDALLNPIIDELTNELLKIDISLYWDGYLRVSDAVCNMDNTFKWRCGGFYRARIGIESGSKHVLDLMGKDITIEQIKAAVSSLAYAGIKTTAYIVIGHPGETKDDFQKTMDLVEELKDDLWEVECNPFGYYYTGQSSSEQWAERRKLLYGENTRDALISQTWILDSEPSREETYNRIFKFTEHCKKLNIPNPYTINEIYAADERWKKLHRNAVPSVVEFENKSIHINENKSVKKPLLAVHCIKNDKDFDF